MAIEPTSKSSPDPDPTTLTTDALLREIGNLEKLLGIRYECLEREVGFIRETVDHRQVVIDSAVDSLQTLHEEKFHSIATQFIERDTRIEQTSRDSKVAVDAALQAAKDAVGEQNKSSALAIAKSEAATTKQIDQLGTQINLMTNGLNDKIEDIKTRLTTIEGRAAGIGAGWGYLAGGVGVLVAIVTLFASFNRMGQ